MLIKYYSRLIVIITVIWFNICYGSLTKQHKHVLDQRLENYYLTVPQVRIDGVKHDWPIVSPTASIEFDLYGEKITIDLQRNDGLIDGAFHHSYQSNGQMQLRQGTYQPFCYYHGRLRQSRMPTVKGKVKLLLRLATITDSFNRY